MPLQIPVTQTGLEASIQQAMKNAGRNAQINLGTNSRQINALAQPLGRITGQADEFTKSMEAANARVFAFGASVGIINGVSRAFGALVKNTIEVEKSLVEINTVLNENGEKLQKFGNKLFDVAKTTGQAFDVVAKGALELARQGLGTEETLKRINDALILSRLSGLDAQQSVEGLTAAFNSFKETGITTSQILNKLVVVSQQYSVSERDLIEGLKRSASVADQAGVSFDELVGIITTVQERTARGGAVIGNAFKTIFARIQDTGALQDLANLGIQVTDLEGKVLPATRILQNLGAEFNNLSQLEQADIAKKLGGVYQLSNLLAAVKDLSSEQSKYNDIVKLSAGATNEAYQKNAALNEALASLINKVSVSAQQLGATLGAIGITDNLKQLLDFFNKILEGIQGILGEESMLGDMFRGLAKGIGGVLAGPGLMLFGAIIAKLSKDLISFGLESLKSFFKIGQSAKEIASVEKSIAAALGSNLTLQKQLFALEGDRAAQIKLMTDAIVQQEAVMRRMTSTAGSLTGPLYQQGVRSTGGQGLRVPKAAGGYMPAVSQESRDISRGVGGAKAGDKPVVISNFAFGGGKKGTMVAHTGEFIVPNFAAGGSAIFNRDMVRSMGLPAGAKKIGAAGGFIPNFAEWYNRDTTKVKTSNSMPTTPGDWVKVKSNSESIRKYSENIDQYRVRDTDFYLFPDGTGSRGNAVRATLGREVSKATINKQKAQAKEEQFGSFTLDANQLGGILVVSPRFGAEGVGSLNTKLQAHEIPLFNHDSAPPIDKNKFIKLNNLKTSNTPKPQNVQGLQGDISQLFAGGIVDLAYRLYGGTFDPASAGEFSQKLKSLDASKKQQLIPAAAQGSLFEAAGKVALNSFSNLESLFGSAEENRPFDFQNATAMQKMFGVSVGRGEAKRGDEKNFTTSKQITGIVKKVFNDPEYSSRALDALEKQGAFSPEMQRKKSNEEVSNAINGFIPNFAKVSDLVRNFSSTLSPKLKLSKSSDSRLHENDSVNLAGNKFNKLFISKKDNENTNQYEQRVLSQLGYISSTGLNFKGNSAIDGYKNATSFVEVKSGFHNEQDTKLKFLRALVENYGTNNPLDVWTNNIDNFKVNGLLVHSDESDKDKKSKPTQLRKDFQISDTLRANKYGRSRRFAGGYIPNFVSQKYIMDTLARIKAGTSGFSKQEQETFLSKFGAKSTGRKISLREVYDKLDGDVGVSALIDKAYMAAGPTASNEDVYRIFEKQIKANPYALRSVVSKKGFVPNFAVDLTKSGDYIENQRKRNFKAGTYRKATGAIGSLFKSLPEKFFADGVLGDGAQGLETNGIFNLIKQNALYGASFAGPKAVKFVTEAEKYGLKVEKSLKDKLAKLVVKSASKIKGYSGGFLPNFADPLKEAIGREISAGVPASQIYVDQNSSLKNSMNPMGLMVANRRDEPGGGMQGVSRARKEGANPMMYGAADGFIPNYAVSKIGEVTKNNSNLAFGTSNQQIASFNKGLENITVGLRNGSIKFNEAMSQVSKLASATGQNTTQVKKLESAGKSLMGAYNSELTIRNQKAQELKKQRANSSMGPAAVGAAGSKNSRDMLGTIFAVQAGLSLLTGATEGATSELGKYTNIVSGGIGTATSTLFAFQGLSAALPKFAGFLGPAGIAVSAATAAFQIGKDIMLELSGANKGAAQNSALLAKAAQSAAMRLDELNPVTQANVKESVKDIRYNLEKGLFTKEGEYIKPQVAENRAEATTMAKNRGLSVKLADVSNEDFKNYENALLNARASGLGTQTVAKTVLDEAAKNNGKLYTDNIEQIIKKLGELSRNPVFKEIKQDIDDIFSFEDLSFAPIDEGLKKFAEGIKKGTLTLEEQGKLEDKLVGLGINRDVATGLVVDALERGKKALEDKNNAQAQANAGISKQTQETLKLIRAQQLLNAEKLGETARANQAEIDNKRKILEISSDLTLSEVERGKKIAEQENTYAIVTAELQAQSEITDKLRESVSELSKGGVAFDKLADPRDLTKAVELSKEFIKNLTGDKQNAGVISEAIKGNVTKLQDLIKGSQALGEEYKNNESYINLMIMAITQFASEQNKILSGYDVEKSKLQNLYNIDVKRTAEQERKAAIVEGINYKLESQASTLDFRAGTISSQQSVNQAKKEFETAIYERTSLATTAEGFKKGLDEINQKYFDLEMAAEREKASLEIKSELTRNLKVDENSLKLVNTTTALNDLKGTTETAIQELQKLPERIAQSIQQQPNTTAIDNSPLARQMVAYPNTSTSAATTGTFNKNDLRGFIENGANVAKLNAQFASNLEKFAKDYYDRFGEELVISGRRSAFRTIEESTAIRQEAIRKGGIEYAKKYTATPGKSQHNFGYAIDIQKSQVQKAVSSGMGLENYGLTRPMSYEPWHVELLGARGKKTNMSNMSAVGQQISTQQLGLSEKAYSEAVKIAALDISKIGEAAEKAAKEFLGADAPAEEISKFATSIRQAAEGFKKLGIDEAAKRKVKEYEDKKAAQALQPKTFAKGWAEAGEVINKDIDDYQYKLGEAIPTSFSNNLAQGIQDAVNGTKSLKDALLDAALSFTQEISNMAIKNLAQQFTSNIFGFSQGGEVKKYASGGMINGGSGSKDDVPAMLMSGEYVVNKKAVQKYGPEFLNAINNGTLSGYAKGGTVKKKTYETQTGEGGYFLPGLYGNESISGSDALMSFATQNYTSGARDIISSGSNFASIDLEQESIRLSQRGRTNSPLFAATQSAKEQALGMVFEQQSRDEEYRKALEEAKRQEKARKKAIRKQLLISSAIAIGSAVAGPLLGAAGAGAKAAFGASKAAGGTLFTNLGAAAKGVFTGGQIGGLTQNVGGLNNLFKGVGQGLSGNFAEAGNLIKLSQIGDMGKFDALYMKNAFANNGKGTSFLDFAQGIGYTPKDINPYSNMGVGLNGGNDFNWFQKVFAPAGSALNNINNSRQQRRATGGTIPEASGIDTVPAMLSGGEFIMNRAAAQNIGAGNLQTLNAGASSLPTEEKTEELNDKLISKLDELIQANSSKSSVGAININVDGSGKSNESSSGGQAGTANQQLARNIRDIIVKVIQDEQRLGGLLR